MMPPKKKIVIVADDHPYVREALERILAGLHACITLYTGEGKEQLLALADRRQKEADVLTVVDVALPDGNKAWVTDDAHAPLMLVTAQERGITASWFVALERNQPAEQTSSRIETAFDQREAVRELIENLSRAEQRAGHEVLLAAQGVPTVEQLTRLGLTQRQAQVLALLAEGLSNKEIARKLDVSHWTVRHHVSSILERINASNRVRATAIARQLGQQQA